MRILNDLQYDDKTVRTQITLTANLKKMIEQKAGLKGQSLSEYLRRAALLNLYLEESNKEELKQLAGIVVGSILPKKHPQWQSKEKVNSWVKKIRSEWQ